MLLNHLAQLRLAGAAERLDLLPVLEEDEGGHRADVVLGGQFLDKEKNKRELETPLKCEPATVVRGKELNHQTK